MWKQYQQSVVQLIEKILGENGTIKHLSPEDSFVWLAEVANCRYIVKTKPHLPYRIHREIRAYEQFRSCSLSIPEVIWSGIYENLPYLILSYSGDNNAKNLFNQQCISENVIVLERILDALWILSKQDHQSLKFVKKNITTLQRDQERLSATQDLPELEDKHKELLERIIKVQKMPYRQLSHRDFSPRQVVLQGNNPTIVDLESIGPGRIERDIGDFMGGILKLGKYHSAYGRLVKAFAKEHLLNFDMICDFVAYSFLWPLLSERNQGHLKGYLAKSKELIQDPNWLTNQ